MHFLKCLLPQLLVFCFLKSSETEDLVCLGRLLYWLFQTLLTNLNTWLSKTEKSIRIFISINKLCSLNYFIFFFRITSQRKASFIVTLQRVIFWLAVITESKCQTLGWCEKSTRTCTVERIQRNSLWNGWPQNQLMTAFTPSRVMCKSIVLCDNKTFSLTLRRTYGEEQLVLSRI